MSAKCGDPRKHPPWRGKDHSQSCKTAVTVETPPRAWGRPLSIAFVVSRHGNTPTGVGKTSSRSMPTFPSRKHPHGRGEDDVIRGLKRYSKETPPRAWGRLQNCVYGRQLAGNTPTGVGKTFTHSSNLLKKWKHPHGRGEDSAQLHRHRCQMETPPRAWGRLAAGDKAVAETRNTPTGVGKTRQTTSR